MTNRTPRTPEEDDAILRRIEERLDAFFQEVISSKDRHAEYEKRLHQLASEVKQLTNLDIGPRLGKIEGEILPRDELKQELGGIKKSLSVLNRYLYSALGIVAFLSFVAVIAGGVNSLAGLF